MELGDLKKRCPVCKEPLGFKNYVALFRGVSHRCPHCTQLLKDKKINPRLQILFIIFVFVFVVFSIGFINDFEVALVSLAICTPLIVIKILKADISICDKPDYIASKKIIRLQMALDEAQKKAGKALKSIGGRVRETNEQTGEIIGYIHLWGAEWAIINFREKEGAVEVEIESRTNYSYLGKNLILSRQEIVLSELTLAISGMKATNVALMFNNLGLLSIIPCFLGIVLFGVVGEIKINQANLLSYIKSKELFWGICLILYFIIYNTFKDKVKNHPQLQLYFSYFKADSMEWFYLHSLFFPLFPLIALVLAVGVALVKSF